MTGTKEIEGGVTKMVVLGGNFEMGDFYDYRNDRIVTGRKCWDSKEIAGATWKDNRFTLKLKSPESGSTKNKWENMGLKEHSQVSIMAGLIENHRGAAKYLNDRDGLSEASQVLICRVKSRKLKLDFKTLISQDVPQLQDLGQETQSEKNPTHVVVGVTYGVEAYCVLVMESDENARKDAEEFLSKIARKMEKALDNYLDLSNFKEQFDKENRTQLTRVKCRMYADLHTWAFRECEIFEAYKQCYKLIQQVQDVGNNESIPIAILLCPLKAISGQVDDKHLEYHDVDPELVARCGLIWNELDRIWAKSVAFRDINKKADNVSFRQFEETITKYKELMQKSLKNELTKARKTGQQYEIEKVINIAENHPIFNPSRLEQWLQYQQAECEMYEKISSITNIVCLSSKKQLEMELQNSFDAKYTLVLSVPLLDERMNGILEAMKNYVDSKLVYMKEDPNADANRSVEADCEGSDDLVHGIQRKQKYVLSKIQEFTNHMEKNKHLENIVQFFIVFRQSVVEFGCRYSVYETRRLLTDNLNQLPRPPTGLRIRPPKTRPARKTTSTYAIDLEWDYEDLGFPCHFLVEYRLDGNKDEVWTQRKTTKSGETQLAIPYTSGSAMTIRVAADTCIGRSEFSEVVDTATVRELNEYEEVIHEKGFLVSKAETYVGPKNEEEMDRSRKTEPAATSMSTSQQPIETKNAEAILLSTSHVVTSDTPRKGWKAPDSTNMSMNEEPMLGMDQENEFKDHMTDDSDEDDCEVVSLEDDNGNDEISEVEEETSNTAIEEHVTKMVVLEGGFQVGDLYDYRSDRILTDGRKYWESRKIGSLIKANNNFSLEFECSDSSTMNNKMENMSLDEHFQATFMAGLIEKPRGGSRYLTYCCSSSQAALVLICRAKSKVVQLDLQNLAIQNVTHLYDTWKKTKSSKSKTNPTHIVVGVTYGAEAYCVLTQDFKDAETDDDSREEAEQFLSNIANKMENALEEELNLAEFKQQFDMNEKKQLSNIKCYLYTDLQTGVAQECSVPDVYKNFLKFIQQVEKTGIGNNKSIPIAVSLCPLQAIMEHDEGGQFEFHDVDPELISRCARIWDELDQVCAKSVVIRTANKKVDKSSLRQFEEAVGKYKSLMQTSLKKGIAKARETGQQSEIEKAAKITENHSIFKPSQLVQWLLYKQGECEMYEKISKMAKNLQLASKKTVEKELGEAFEIKFTMVLGLPSLTQRTNKILQAMKEYTEKYNTLVPYDDEENETDDNVEEESNMPWNQQTQKYVLSKVREFAEHVEKNKHLENQVQFFVNFCETDKDVGCRYSVYDATRLLKDNIFQLPKPPTGLRVHAPKTSNPPEKNIVLAWDYAELGFPCYFLVEYRPCDGNDETWTQKKTTKPRETQITIPYETRSAIEFRVAADTCIGRSEFSEVVDTVTVRELNEDEEAIHEKEFLVSKTETYVGPKNEEEMDRSRKTEPAATSMSTSQQPIETKNAEAILLSTSHVVTYDTPRKGWKAPDSTNTTMNEEILLRIDRENKIGDHMTDYSNKDDAKPNCKTAYLEEDDGDDEKTQAKGKIKNNAIEQHVTEMVVLEGGFQLGDLYDYRSDRILTEGRKYVESSKIGYPIKVNNKLSLEFKCSDSSTMNNKMENMGLDEHLQASFMAGLIEKPRGGSRYLTYCCSSSQAAQVLICRVESKVTQLDLQNLTIPDVTHLYDTLKKTKSFKSKTNPTHIVVGVTYGAEAYCVLTQDLKDAETDDDSREEAEQFLSNIANKMENALEEELNLAEFKQQFDMNEKKQLSNIKCYLYTDLQTGVVQECSVPDVYKHFLKFTQQVKKTGNGNNKSIPIAVSLCPLQAIMEHDEGGQFEFHDVDPELISRCVRIWDELDQVCAKSVVIRTANKKVDKSSLRQFEEAVGKYKSLMQTSLKKGIAKARETGQQSEIEKAAKITENHSIFKPSQLVQWLLYKQGECEMYEKISKMAKNLQLASKKTVEKQLGEAFDIKHTVVLSLPCLEQRTNKILRALKDYTEKYNTLVTYDDEENETDDNVEEESNMPWNQQTQKYVLSKVREFAEHVEKNKHLENQVQFFMTFCETDKDVGCRYSVYDATRLLKDNISQLPKPPTGLRVHAPKTSNPPKKNIVLAWDYAELGFPYHFLVEYRRCDGNDETWTQKKTTNPRETQITIPYKTRSAIEFRVAADTCIGRSEFSEVINTESECDAVDDEETSSDTVSTYSEAGTADIRRRSEMRKTGTAASLQTSQPSTKNIRAAIKPPTDVEVETVTQSTAELGWVTSATENRSISYRVRYWQYGQDESQANELEVAVGESGCRLEGLLPETTYNINIVAVSNGGREMSEPSETLHLVTVHQHVRFAETMAKCGIKIGDRNGMNLLAVPLTKSPRSNSTVVRFAFGKESGSRTVLHKTILVMGATGAGKTTLINGMINYIFNVEWEDTFRFQLIREQLVGSSQSQSQTSGITAYDIHHAEGFRVPYSLTIVDTPGYGDTKGLDRDKEITEMIRKFFEDKSGIQNLDIIGFVAQASLPRLTPTQIYIFDSVLSIFGKDVEENIDFLLTFADGQNPPILSAIAAAGLPYPKEPGTGLPRHHKFNNSGFFCSNRESGSDASNTAEKFNRFFWRMGMENFQRFFSTLAAMKTKSLSLTKQVLEERRRLEATVEGLQPLIKIGLTKMEEMRKTKQVITNSQAQIDANENVEIEVEVHEAVQVKYDGGCLTNCNKCHVTCHIPCYLGNTENKLNCAAMDHSMPAETRSCTVCPQKCIWNLHENQPYKWEYVKRKKTTSSDAIKEKYEAEMNRKLTAQQLVEVLERDVQKNDAEVLQQVETVTQCIKRLEEIALRPNPFSTPEYIDLIIDAEQQEKRQGYKERIESLKKLRKMAVITSKIKNNENLMSLDRKDDYEA
ncbi:hypothetical protein OUZ56_030764 [Daphnia magna]|uniref:Fibronectin type-III domain-containing protein n=1 Tax=Daphnia magna TaxID=35525 RepID=A0ABQ9ZS89_9CRUS|nr:hypothetical protein OUZ56_030764 [Daphnia magna]